MKKLIYILCCFFTSSIILAQQQLIGGKIDAPIDNLEGIVIKNTTTNKMVFSDKNGQFKIHASPSDYIEFSSVQLENKSVLITSSIYFSAYLFVRLDIATTQLKEVVVEKSTITAKSLGIPVGKKYTKAEANLKTATDTKVTPSLGGMAGAAVGLDPILNWISGRTKMLKKELEAEKRQMTKERLERTFKPAFYTENLKIPNEKIEAFLYYVSAKDTIIAMSKSATMAQLEFELINQAQAFMAMQ